MDNQQVQIFKEWFIDAYPECKDYLDLTYFDVEKNTFIAKCSYNPDSGNAAKVLRIAFGSWQHQQAKVEELQVQLKGAEECAQLTLKYKDKYRLEREELQKRVDAALQLIPSIKAENDLWGCDQVERQIELLEQALKGEGQ
ncbi:TPA: hypothetical protein MW161_000562 [Acinetobacter baumannii]|nr:hypothetical protein [Acinetobacter baumannii]